MKVKILSRNPDQYLPETKRDIPKVSRNYDPSQHPFEAAREYVRAVNSAKLERLFAKPFIGSLDGHRDGVQCLICHPQSLSTLVSGAYDGEIRVWNLADRRCLRSVQAHRGIVRGLCFSSDGKFVFSVGDDQNIKQWDLVDLAEPVGTLMSKTNLLSIDHHYSDSKYATCGEAVEIWDEARSHPIRSYSWGADSVHAAKFNCIETNIIASCSADRSIVLHDIRQANPLRKVTLAMKTNTLCWNPMEAYIFTAANEDYNCYSFDMRNLSTPTMVYSDHVSAVLDLDYSPTGKEFVTASYDKTIRIFPVEKGHSREIYHTKRMQRVTSIRYSRDNRFIISGSDEMNIRLWKSHASEKLGYLAPRETAAFRYSEKLKEKYGHHPQVKRILRHRHLPKHVYNAKKQNQESRFSKKRKEANRRAHSKPGAVPYVPERKKAVINEQE
ncbi:DDB1- and CUL4-associated factor 13-like [Paramacrobiotus metropolitanus]|uniref:DDB1- and CUL4-associated factor 13-like n=1 Tax=Paramacrobiotus metropolitanus TaxID=2943436 RepID=UPI0024465131|nr:DDB1- and CUL4-associated factor 13-like [Paramacrobiotus metropolitanus]